MAAYRFGKDAVLYYTATALDGASNDAAAVTWTEYDNVRDVNGNFTATKVDGTTRATAKLGWESELVILNKGELTFELPQLVANDTVLDALIAGWLNQTAVTLMALDGPEATSGNQGLAANFNIEMTRGEPVKDVLLWSVTASVDSFPEWYEVP